MDQQDGEFPSLETTQGESTRRRDVKRNQALNAGRGDSTRDYGGALATKPHRFLGILVGGIIGVALALMATLVVRRVWPAYVLAEPTKAYSLQMLAARLTVGALCMVGAAWVATRIASRPAR